MCASTLARAPTQALPSGTIAGAVYTQTRERVPAKLSPVFARMLLRLPRLPGPRCPMAACRLRAALQPANAAETHRQRCLEPTARYQRRGRFVRAMQSSYQRPPNVCCCRQPMRALRCRRQGRLRMSVNNIERLNSMCARWQPRAVPSPGESTLISSHLRDAASSDLSPASLRP